MKNFFVILALVLFPLFHAVAIDGLDTNTGTTSLQNKDKQHQKDQQAVAPTNTKTPANNVNAVNARALNALQQQHANQTINLNDYGIVISKDITSFESLISNVIKILSKVAAPLAILSIMVHGGMLMTSFGDEEQTTRGKKGIFYSIIGLVLTLGAYAILSFVQVAMYSLGK